MSNKALYYVELFLVFLIGLSSLFLTYPNVKLIIDGQLIVYFLIVLVNYWRKKSFNLFQIWIVGYVFIVWSEMEIIATEYYNSTWFVPFIRYTISNFVFMLGYYLYNRNERYHRKTNSINQNSRLFLFLIIVLYLYFVILKFNETKIVYFTGRSYGSGNSMGTGSLSKIFLDSIGLLLPSLIGYYYRYVFKKGIWFSFFLVFPIFVILLLTTSRYKFLFSTLPYFIITGIVDLQSSNLKKSLVLLLFFVVILKICGYIKNNRNVAFAEVESREVFGYNFEKGDNLFETAAYRMSPEGVVKMAAIADDYFSKNNLHYGKETGFIFIFWIPRNWWPNKPTMLDGWLIREYENVSEGFSSASGYIGELRADFGWFCLLFVLLLGMLIRKLDNYTQYVYNNCSDSFDLVLISVLYPWVFFCIRSPLTSTISLIMELILWWLFSLLLFSHKSNS